MTGTLTISNNVTLADADWVIDLAEEAYGRSLDRQMCRDWMAELLSQRNVFFRKSANIVGIAVSSHDFWSTDSFHTHMLYLFGRKRSGWEAYKMVVTMAVWSKSIGATAFHFGSSGVDLSAFAIRMQRYGLTQDRPSWTIPTNP